MMENTQIGPFLILERLGTARRQKVWRARQLEQSREVALKFITLPPKFDRSRALEKLSVEFDTLRALKHPNLARVYGAGVFEDKVFVATELVDGESLSGMIARRGRIAADVAIDYARQIASCLVFLHAKGLLHNKLTPDKILVRDDGTVKVTDLRINRKRKLKPQRQDRRDMELVAYLAPEHLGGQTSPKSDLYSLGIVLYEMLTGKLPFAPENLARISHHKRTEVAPPISQTVLDCPIWLDRLVLTLLDPNPRRRPHSAESVRLTLEEIQSASLGQKAAVEKIGGSFNPLNAGADKTEALRLLRGQVPAVLPDPVAWYKRTSVLLLMMATVVAITVWQLWPPRTGTLLEQASALMRSDTPESQRAARAVLEQIIDRDPDSDESVLARRLLAESHRITLIELAKNGRTNSLQSPAVRAFVAAWQDETNCLFNEAWRRYDAITVQHRDSAEDQYVVEEAGWRRDSLAALRDLPYDDRALLDWIENSSGDAKLGADEKRHLLFQLEGVVERLEGSPIFAACVAAARKRLKELTTQPVTSR